MLVEQRKWTESDGWVLLHKQDFPASPQLVLAFGSSKLMADSKNYDVLKEAYPSSHIVMATTAGEIIDTSVCDDTIVVSALYFDKTTIEVRQCDINNSDQSYEVGKAIATELPQEKLVHVLTLTDGLKVNGTALVKGIGEILPKSVSTTGGLVGDGASFKQTLTGLDQPPTEGKVIAIGFYGDNIKVGYGSLGGWDDFGPERLITKSKNNVLFEIDNQPALKLYKDYLGDQASELPGSGLLFPMSLRIKNDNGTEVEVVRTVLSVDETAQSVTFAGDMPEGVYARLMKANFDRLIDGAAGAADMSKGSFLDGKPDFALLISCVGRKLVLKERSEEEIEAVRNSIGDQAAIIGYYSYGEICPTSPTEKQCQLHNQTMTITTFKES